MARHDTTGIDINAYADSQRRVADFAIEMARRMDTAATTAMVMLDLGLDPTDVAAACEVIPKVIEATTAADAAPSAEEQAGYHLIYGMLLGARLVRGGHDDH